MYYVLLLKLPFLGLKKIEAGTNPNFRLFLYAFSHFSRFRFTFY